MTDVGGNAAVLGPQLSHRLVPSANPEALASAWQEILENSEGLKCDGLKARQRVQEAFGLEALVRSYERAYVGTGDGAASHASSSSYTL